MNKSSISIDRVCEWCKKEFVAIRYNTKFCSPGCRKESNNKRCLGAYHEKKALRKNIKPRKCKTEQCITILSRYNDTKYCSLCQRKQFVERVSSWGFDPDEVEQHWLIN